MIVNAKSQTDAMLKGLDRISYLVGFYSSWENLYLAEGTDKLRETVVKLYTGILTYQARLLYYLNKGFFNHLVRNATKHDDWEGWLAEVNLRESDCFKHGQLANVTHERHHAKYQESLLDMQLKTAKEMLKEFKLANRRQLDLVSDQKRTALLQSFSSDYVGQKDLNPNGLKGTCEWFTKDQRFLDWRDSQKPSLLHVSAGPGCGKSTLAKHLIDSKAVRPSDSAVVAYFFFKDAQQGRDRCADAITSMLHQIYSNPSRADLVVHALPRFEAHGKNLVTMFEELWTIFEKTVEDPASEEVICIFDALDECVEEDRSRLLRKLTTYFGDDSAAESRDHDMRGRLKVIITSRPYDSINLEYQEVADSAHIVQLDGADRVDLIAKEIDLVIKAKVAALFRNFSEKDQWAVVKQLRQYDNRTYLWLHLVFDFIKKDLRRAHSQEAHSIPRSPAARCQQGIHRYARA